jgi:LPXTG-motif cell wall-anchored protein
MTKLLLLLDIAPEPVYSNGSTRNPWMLIGSGIALVALIGWFIWKRKRDRNNPPV